MPVKPTTYQGPPFYLFNGHLETIIPSLYRKIDGLNYLREKIPTPDNDFLNLDWSKVGSRRLLIISHGLEGDSERHYVRGLAKLFNSNQIDVLAWNNRSCGGEMNLQPVLYHHGADYDLKTVISHVVHKYDYEEIFLTGISMGGAQTLNYLGKNSKNLPAQIKKAAVYSTPCDLPSSAATLKSRRNVFYKKRFLGKLKDKMRRKALQFPNLIDLDLLEQVQDFDSFDTLFTAKLHGFEDARDFYQSASPGPWIEKIPIPTLIVNALNDPLLGEECYPVKLAERKSEIILEMPKRGGHTGFILSKDEFTWAEYRFLRFFLEE